MFLKRDRTKPVKTSFQGKSKLAKKVYCKDF